ncbi:2Fe-2S iron-sulfur cluster-binding protein [Dactylosporangium sp. NPDC048998]|uniref:2Fe-2S iron-sulfur cluster-binding protein n=1 Tax=Dactylosporangium sp. NPDC048998 TaxID=3363976 RepID=UPI0037132404
MMKITYITPRDGAEHEVEFKAGDSVMVTAVNNDVPGIEGECGGEMNCGTCHVYVGESWRDRFADVDWDEGVMLDIVDDRRPESRLGCQLKLREDLDGIVVTVATGEA